LILAKAVTDICPHGIEPVGGAETRLPAGHKGRAEMSREAMMGLIEMALALYASQPMTSQATKNPAEKPATANAQRMMVMIVASDEIELGRNSTGIKNAA